MCESLALTIGFTANCEANEGMLFARLDMNVHKGLEFTANSFFLFSQRLDLSSIWALLAAFEDPLSMSGGERLPFEGAFVKGVDSVSWMANNTAKLGGEGLDCWTFFSTAAFGKRHKVPQVKTLEFNLRIHAMELHSLTVCLYDPGKHTERHGRESESGNAQRS